MELATQYFSALTRCWRDPEATAGDCSVEVARTARICLEAPLMALRQQGILDDAYPLATKVRRSIRELHAQSLRRQREIAQLVKHLRDAGTEPILLKGWSIARKYAQPTRRPLGDIDLAVEPAQLALAHDAVKRFPGGSQLVDLHAGVPDVADASWRELRDRSLLIPLHQQAIRVLGPVDELKQLCVHLWRHSGRRALWICDVACAVEALPDNFDWAEVSRTPWIGNICQVVIGLARELLGAEVRDPTAVERMVAPGWVRDTILQCHATRIRRALASEDPNEFIKEGTQRIWGDPMRTVFRTHVSPYRNLTLIHAAGVMSRPVQYAARIRRHLARGEATGVMVHEVKRF